MAKKYRLFLICFFFAGCQSLYKKPSVRVVSIDFRSFKGKELNLMARLNVDNPNFYSMSLKELNYTFIHGESVIASGNYQKEFVVLSSASNDIQLPLKVDLVSAFNLTRKIFSAKKDLEVRCSGRVVFKTFLGEKTLDFEQSKSINVF